jgi:hypothetical protein
LSTRCIPLKRSGLDNRLTLPPVERRDSHGYTDREIVRIKRSAEVPGSGGGQLEDGISVPQLFGLPPDP